MLLSIVSILFLLIGSASAAEINGTAEDIDVYDNFIMEMDSQDNTLQEGVIQTVLSGNDTELYYKDGTALKVVLSDSEGSFLANQSIIFTINNINYTRTTNDEGIAAIAINLKSGTYNISSFYSGNEKYAPFSTTNTVKVLSTISGENVGKYYRGDRQYYATFLDSQGSYLRDTMVTFNINGVFYQRKTNENGVAKLNINLLPGKYILTATNPVNGETYSNNITVLTTLEASDMVKYYRNGTQYLVNVLDGEGNPLVNQKVTFNINGVFYDRSSNENGIAKLNINLGPNNYTITAVNSFNGEVHSNNIEVLPTISAGDLNMAYRDGHKFTANVLDDVGNPLSASSVVFNINGVFYNRNTDENGTAKLNINLDVGEYIITSTDYRGLSVSNKINIVKSNSTIEDLNVHIISGLDRDYTVTLYGSNNKTIPFAAIKFKCNGVGATAVTDENGEATILISNPSEGKYSVEYEFDGNINYYPYKSSNVVTADKSTTILSGKDLKMLYNDGSKFKATLKDASGVPIANGTVKFDIGGNEYVRTTDGNGVAGLNINLIPGTYEISYSYSDVNSPDYNEGSNTIVVSKLPAYLSTEDLAFEYGDSKEFTATLTDASKKPLNDTPVTFSINDKPYVRTTDENGVARLSINLGVGYYEIVTSLDNMFYAASSTSNHVLVDGAIFIADDLYLVSGFSRDYSLTLLDAYRNPISNVDIEFTYNGISQHANTDAQGVATITVGGLAKGDYLIVYNYAERNTAGQSNIRVSQSVLNSKNTISNLSPYLSSTSHCHVSNAEIVALAQQLTGSYTQPLDKAIAIFDYVRDNIPYSYYYNTYYGAVGTLHAQKGNCVDQAHLLVALYRAAGFPARYVHGTCVFRDGDVDGHVWTQVLVGGTWIVGDSINTRNSLGDVVNWNNDNYRLKGYYSSLPF